jgi:hypothetical protein
MEKLRREEHHMNAMTAEACGLAVGLGLPAVSSDRPEWSW